MMGSINIAVPNMMTSLRADLSQIQWVLTAFMIARTVVMPTLSWLGSRLGNRRLYLTSLLVYLASCMLCGLSWSLESMLVFRVLQGMSAGYLTPLGMAILHETYPPGKRGTAMGIFMAGMSFGPALGPTVGGYLVEHLSWRAVFYINLPIGLVALVGSVLVTLPEGERRQSEELDLLGLTTMTTWVVSLLLAVSQARLYGWGSMYILTLLAIAGVSLLAFVAAEWTCAAPLVNLQVFANGQFVLGAVANFCESFTNFALSFIVALFLQQGLGFDAAHAGEIMLPSACIWGLTSLATGRLSDRIESRWLILIGSLSQAVSGALCRPDVLEQRLDGYGTVDPAQPDARLYPVPHYDRHHGDPARSSGAAGGGPARPAQQPGWDFWGRLHWYLSARAPGRAHLSPGGESAPGGL